ncbi:MAG: hypothetical protein KAQ68_03825 [Clostridiales bacterium]|nr:hypothetical protein [Clostridiales bacterium]
MLFYVKVRIDTDKLLELGQKLQSGELDTSCIKATYCLKEDPSIGMSIWEASSQEDFDKKIAPMKKYYKDIMEIMSVITQEESMVILMQ